MGTSERGAYRYCLDVNLPSEIVEALEIKRGDTLLISLNAHQIIMEKEKKGKS